MAAASAELTRIAVVPLSRMAVVACQMPLIALIPWHHPASLSSTCTPHAHQQPSMAMHGSLSETHKAFHYQVNSALP